MNDGSGEMDHDSEFLEVLRAELMRQSRDQNGERPYVDVEDLYGTPDSVTVDGQVDFVALSRALARRFTGGVAASPPSADSKGS